MRSEGLSKGHCLVVECLTGAVAQDDLRDGSPSVAWLGHGSQSVDSAGILFRIFHQAKDQMNSFAEDTPLLVWYWI